LLAQQAMVPQVNQLAADTFTNASYAAEQAAAAQSSATTAANQVTLAANQVSLAADQVDLAEAEVIKAQNAVAAAAAGPNSTATSTSSVGIGAGSKTFTVQTGKTFVPGQFFVASNSPGNFMHGQITSYDSGTGALVGNITAFGGTGTFASWQIGLSSPMTSSLAETLSNKTLTDPKITLGGTNGTAGQVPVSQGPGLPPVWSPGFGIVRVPRTSNTTLAAGNRGNLIAITSGTFTQTFDACSSLGAGWFVYLQNAGTGDITLDPNGSETIDSLTSFVMYPGEVRLVICNGTSFNSVVLSSFYKVFTTSGTFIKPPGYTAFDGLMWGAGGNGSLPYGAGGGGACVPLTGIALGASASVSIGASGGASSIIGSLVAYGGGSSVSGQWAGGGGWFSSGASNLGGAPAPVAGHNDFGGGNAIGGNGTSIWGGGAGGGNSSGLGLQGGNSVYGGGGGASSASSASSASAGTSVYGGNGGGPNTNGGVPGGGGGGGTTVGGRGELRIWGIV
jgi:hypothetical protein